MLTSPASLLPRTMLLTMLQVLGLLQPLFTAPMLAPPKLLTGTVGAGGQETGDG